MPYKIIEHTQIAPNTRCLKVLINPEEEESKQITESFQWGMDVPLEQVLAETRLLLDAKYAQPVELEEVVL